MKRKTPSSFSKGSQSKKQKFQKKNYRSDYGTKPLQYRGKELKFLDWPLDGLQFSTSGGLVHLCSIGQGTDNVQRIGRTITLKSVYIRGSYYVNQTTPKSTVVRYLLIYDRSPQGGLPAISDFMTAVSFDALMNLNNTERFSVLLDKTDNLEIQQSTIKPFKHYLKLNLPMTFNGTGSSIANVASGALYFVTLGDESVIGSPALIRFGNSRIRFTDV